MNLRTDLPGVETLYHLLPWTVRKQELWPCNASTLGITRYFICQVRRNCWILWNPSYCSVVSWRSLSNKWASFYLELIQIKTILMLESIWVVAISCLWFWVKLFAICAQLYKEVGLVLLTESPLTRGWWQKSETYWKKCCDCPQQNSSFCGVL